VLRDLFGVVADFDVVDNLADSISIEECADIVFAVLLLAHCIWVKNTRTRTILVLTFGS
jgi:hypothetical protein